MLRIWKIYSVGGPVNGACDKTAVAFVDAIDRDRVTRYEHYFETLKPVNDDDRFKRALFAFASVHTTWQLNCILYEMLASADWLKDPQLLMLRLTESGAGLHNNRYRFIWDFAQKFWTHPEWYAKQRYEDWFQYRDRLDNNIKGLGLAKAAFFSELIYFEKSQVACMDVHLLRLFHKGAIKFNQSKSGAAYAKWCEHRWTDICVERDVSPVTARWIYWDTKQNKDDSRYWSKVLEGSRMGARQRLLFPEAEIKALVSLPPEKVNARHR